jgi:hypothetical protein
MHSCCWKFKVQPLGADGGPVEQYSHYSDYVRTGLLGFLGPVSRNYIPKVSLQFGMGLLIGGTDWVIQMYVYTKLKISKPQIHWALQIWLCDNVGSLADLGPVYMRLGQIQTGMKMEIVNMFTWDRYENKKKSISSPCQAIFFFRWLLLACVVPMSRLQPRPVWNQMYLCLHSSQSEFMPACWSQSARSSRRNDLRLIWVIFVPVSCKHLL